MKRKYSGCQIMAVRICLLFLDFTSMKTETVPEIFPKDQMHPHHAGDLPPLMSVDGYAWSAFYDDVLELYNIVGRAVIIHRNPDDFTTQPSGNAGEMMACGVIRLMS